MLTRRAAPLSLFFAVAGSLVLVIAGNEGAAVVLTATAVVGIINTVLLEKALTSILQPDRPRFSVAAVFYLGAHLAVWGGLLTAVFRWRHDIALWAVAAGVGCFLLGLAAAGAGAREQTPGEE